MKYLTTSPKLSEFEDCIEHLNAITSRDPNIMHAVGEARRLIQYVIEYRKERAAANKRWRNNLSDERYNEFAEKCSQRMKSYRQRVKGNLT